MMLRPFYAILTALLLGASLSGHTAATADGIHSVHEKTFIEGTYGWAALPPTLEEHDPEDIGAPYVALVKQSRAVPTQFSVTLPFVKEPDAQRPPARASPL